MFFIDALAVDVEQASPFSIYDTDSAPFYLDNGEKIKATTMYKSEVTSKYISYYKEDDIIVLTMDLKEYNKTQFEFMAIINLSPYVENVSKEQINEIDKHFISTTDVRDGVDLSIPKFKFSYDLKLKNDLMKLGIKDAFVKKKKRKKTLQFIFLSWDALYINTNLKNINLL